MDRTQNFTTNEKLQFLIMEKASNFFGLLGFGFAKYFGKFLGFIMWHCLKSRRRLAVRSIRDSFNVSRERARKIARRSFEHTARAFLEVNLAKVVAKNSSKIVINIAQPELFRRFMECEKAIVAATAHFGAWELLAYFMGEVFPEDRKRMIVVRQYTNKASHAFIASCREANGCQMIGHRRVTFNVIRALKEKGVVAFLVDHHSDAHEALRLNFLGRKASVTMGPALLALRGGAMVFPVFLERDKKKSNVYTFHVLEPLDTTQLKSTSREGNVEEIAEFYTQAVEEMVTNCPEQWFWMHRRWK